MEWDIELSLKLIKLYRDRPTLWDPSNKEHKLLKKKNEYWSEIADDFNCDVIHVKKKMDSLLSGFRRERRRRSKTQAGAPFRSKWFAFKALQFLDDKFISIQTTPQCLDADSNAEDTTSTTHVECDVSFQEELPKSEQRSSIRVKNNSQKLISSENNQVPTVKRAREEDPRVDDNFQILKTFAETKRSSNDKDECTAFGNYVASQLKNFDIRTRAYAKHQISNILFRLEIGELPQNIDSQQVINWT